jgi:thiol-disulfide isomerase/thioredoxin
MPSTAETLPQLHPKRRESEGAECFLRTTGRAFGVIRLGLFLLIALCSAFAGQPQMQAPVGLWDGSIQSRAGEVSFRIALKQQSMLTAVLVNATDQQPFSSATWDGNVLTLRLDYYDGQLTLHYVSPQRMEGEYSRQTSKGVIHIPVTLVPNQESPATKQWTGPTLAGDWLLRQAGAEGAEKNTLTSFQQENMATADGKVCVTGILEPVDGDTGSLHGRVSTDANGQTHFHLSRFDGIHVLALDGVFAPDGSLQGQIGGIKALSSFTAERSKNAAIADPNALAGSLTKVKDPQQPFHFGGVDQAGNTVDQSSPGFKGKAVIVDIFGTWCPNCHDEAPLLEQLYRKYRAQGLIIVGLAYEYVDDTARDLRQMGIYRDRYGITFPLLLAGTTDQGQIEKTLPQLVNFGAYPTTIFLDRNGRVHAIHAGFAGPSTGEKYLEVQQHMDQLAREILGPSN